LEAEEAVIHDLDIYRAAAILVKLYDKDALITAPLRADAMLEGAPRQLRNEATDTTGAGGTGDSA
jgi:hypothetical protein